jgi:hypothetical protein
MDVSRVAHITVDLWTHPIHQLKGFKNAGRRILLEKLLGIDLYHYGAFQLTDRLEGAGHHHFFYVFPGELRHGICPWRWLSRLGHRCLSKQQTRYN